MTEKRTPEFERNIDLTKALKVLNDQIKDLEVIESTKEFNFPPIFIMGCARSGSTLLMQSLAFTEYFTYPSNLIARFYSNPAFGAYVQKILLDFDSKEQIFKKSDMARSKKYSSKLGHSFGPIAPNEFWYFWRMYFPFGKTNFLSDDDLSRVDISGFLDRLKALEAVYMKPLLMKGMILNWNIPYLFKNIPKALFVFLERDPFFAAQSILESRKRFYGSIKPWWSFKPPEYLLLKDKDPYEQVVGQIFFTNKAIAKGLRLVPDQNIIKLRYEEICLKPEDVFKRIINKVYEKKKGKYNGVKSFPVNNFSRLGKREEELIKKAISKYY